MKTVLCAARTATTLAATTLAATTLAATTLAAATLATAAQAQPNPPYRQVAAVPLGAPDRFDYVIDDAPGGRIYVAHGDRVSVVDAATLRQVGEVAGVAGGTHGAFISHKDGVGVTDDGKAGKAVLFDLKSLKVIKALDAAPDADAIAGDPKSGHVFVINGDSGSITVVDPAKAVVAATITVGGGLEYAVADGRGALYVNGAERSEIVKIDTVTNQVLARWPVADCKSPHGLAIDTARRRLFTSCVNSRLDVVDADTGKEVASLPIGAGTDTAAYDPVRRRVFSSNGRDGSVSVIEQVDADTYRPLATVPTAVTARTMAVDARTGRLFVAGGKVDPAGQPPGKKILPGSLQLMVFEPAK